MAPLSPEERATLAQASPEALAASLRAVLTQGPPAAAFEQAADAVFSDHDELLKRLA